MKISLSKNTKNYLMKCLGIAKKKQTFPTVSFVTSVQEARSLFQKFRHPHVCVPQDSAGSLGTFPLKAFLFVFYKK